MSQLKWKDLLLQMITSDDPKGQFAQVMTAGVAMAVTLGIDKDTLVEQVGISYDMLDREIKTAEATIKQALETVRKQGVEEIRTRELTEEDLLDLEQEAGEDYINKKGRVLN